MYPTLGSRSRVASFFGLAELVHKDVGLPPALSKLVVRYQGGGHIMRFA